MQGKLATVTIALLWNVSGTWKGCSASYVTVGGRSDGFGGQLHGQLSCLLMGKMLPNLTYAHTAFKSLEHVKDNGEDWDRVRQLEAFVNLGYDEIPISQVPSDEIVNTRAYCHEYTEMNLALYELLRGELLRKFAANKRLVKAGRKVTDSFTVEVHVHIRRGDISPAHRQYMSAELYHDMLTGMRRGLEVHGVSMDVHIHSEGDGAGFEKIVEDFDASLHLDEDMLQTWYALMSAPVLVMSQSSFSYTAGLYNQGMVVYSTFLHGPLPSWVVYENDPSQVEREFASRKTDALLRNRMQNARRVSFAGVVNRYSVLE